MKTRISALIVLSVSLFASPLLHAQTPDTQKFKRLTPAQMQEIASKDRLSHRIFYKPSQGPDAAWFDAVKAGDLETIKKMHAKGQNLEAKDEAEFGQTALGWAAFIGYLDVVRYLVESGANLFATDRADVQHAFKSAILGGNMPVIEYLYPLLKDKININAQDERDEETALMVAAWNNRVGAVKFLLSHGARFDIVSKAKGTMAYDQSALTYACKQGNSEVVKLLLGAGAVNHHTGKPQC